MDIQENVSNKTADLIDINVKHKIKLQNEDKNIPFEENLTKDFYREKALAKALNYEKIKNSLKINPIIRKEVIDYYNMNNRLIKEFSYPDMG